MALRAFQVPLTTSVRPPLCCKWLACSHTPSFLSCVCVCVCVCACPRLHNTSLARRRWLWCSDQNRKRLHHRLEGRRFCWIFCMEGQSCSLWSTKRAPRNLSFKFVFSPLNTRDVWPERRAGMLRFCARFQTDFLRNWSLNSSGGDQCLNVVLGNTPICSRQEVDDKIRSSCQATGSYRSRPRNSELSFLPFSFCTDQTEKSEL